MPFIPGLVGIGPSVKDTTAETSPSGSRPLVTSTAVSSSETVAPGIWKPSSWVRFFKLPFLVDFSLPDTSTTCTPAVCDHPCGVSNLSSLPSVRDLSSPELLQQKYQHARSSTMTKAPTAAAATITGVVTTKSCFS